jgi:hypothetical protein
MNTVRNKQIEGARSASSPRGFLRICGRRAGVVGFPGGGMGRDFVIRRNRTRGEYSGCKIYTLAELYMA